MGHTERDLAIYQANLAGKNKSRPEGAQRSPVAAVATLGVSTDEAKLNKTERAYLGYLRALGYKWIGIQNITLKLAHDCRLTPDFCTFDHGKMRLIDVKGFQREDALIKMKVAARMFPWADFVIVKADGTGWDHTPVKP